MRNIKIKKNVKFQSLLSWREGSDRVMVGTCCKPAPWPGISYRHLRPEWPEDPLGAGRNAAGLQHFRQLNYLVFNELWH